MNRMIDFLADFCRTRLLEEKIFIVPSFSIGRQIGDVLARKEGSWINLRFVTLSSLAQETVAGELENRGLKLVPETGLKIQVDILFRRLKDEGKLSYFQELRPTPGLAEILYRALQSLRSAGISAGNLDVRAFRVEAKGRDLSLLLGLYEDYLNDRNYLDLPGLYLFAANR